MTKKEVKSIIDNCIGMNNDYVESQLKTLFDRLIPHILANYNNSRDLLQFTLGELERIYPIAIDFMFKEILNFIPLLKTNFHRPNPKDNDYVNINWNEDDYKKVIYTVSQHYPSKFYLHVPNMGFANSCSYDERRKFCSFILDSIQYHGSNTQWDKNTIEDHQLLLAILYAICKKDSQMWYLFYYANNFTDRLATSNETQAARDIAETILIIGHQENMRTEAYFCAARTYTILNNPLGGLLFLSISLWDLKQNPKPLPYKFSFELLWQILKIARGLKLYSEKLLKPVLYHFDLLNPLPYDIVSFYHTYYSLVFYEKGPAILEDVADFLDRNREFLFSNLDHAAMPWLSLLFSVKKYYPNVSFTRLAPYVQAFKNTVDRTKNTFLLELFDEINLDSHLKELMVKLQKTRNLNDYSRDTYYANIIAQTMISQSSRERNSSQFILAMQVRSDFTFVRPETAENSLFNSIEFEDVDGKDYGLPIEDSKNLVFLMQQGQDNEVIWIGKGSDGLYSMSLLNNIFDFKKLDSLAKVNIERMQSDIICKLHYQRDIQKEGEPIYIKDKTELEKEASELKGQLSDAKIPISKHAKRLILAKDMDVAAYPHQLFINESGSEFIGELLPSCNILSTEVLIKTNFEQPLKEHPKCSYWTPNSCEEFTFDLVKSKLEELFHKYSFIYEYQGIPSNPIDAEINVVCAHGGKDISNTQWFYADDKPIVDTEKIIGRGKLLILFVCHSGSISRSYYDNEMHTLIKRYIRMGYSSVIAPMWSLNIEILPLWLATFMEELTQGSFVIDALYRANTAVRQNYTSPEVYACLHLFGNPFLQIADDPILTIEQKPTDKQ